MTHRLLTHQNRLLFQLKEVEKSVSKWRKNKKDLESQLDSIAKVQFEINQKISRKTNDIKSMNVEVDAFKKRIDANKKATEAVKKSIGPMKNASNVRLASYKTRMSNNVFNRIVIFLFLFQARVQKITEEIKRLEALEKSEQKIKLEKDEEGAGYIKEAREDLQKICKSLLQKKLEKEDLAAEVYSKIFVEPYRNEW